MLRLLLLRVFHFWLRIPQKLCGHTILLGDSTPILRLYGTAKFAWNQQFFNWKSITFVIKHEGRSRFLIGQHMPISLTGHKSTYSTLTTFLKTWTCGIWRLLSTKLNRSAYVTVKRRTSTTRLDRNVELSHLFPFGLCRWTRFAPNGQILAENSARPTDAKS